MNNYHNCHAFKCEAQVIPSLLMCRKHWGMLPANLQREVWRHYRNGQEKDKKITEAYARAESAAVNYVAIAEGYSGFDVDAKIAFMKKKGHFDHEK